MSAMRRSRPGLDELAQIGRASAPVHQQTELDPRSLDSD